MHTMRVRLHWIAHIGCHDCSDNTDNRPLSNQGPACFKEGGVLLRRAG
jgi:hypothetical protein